MNVVKILGKDVKDKEEGNIKSDIAAISYLVKKGHDVCGDSAFIYSDETKAILAVFDGVSGMEGADQASSIAALSVLNFLKGFESPNKDDLQEALIGAHANIVYGSTTALVAIILKDGSFVAGSVGDSALYSSGKSELKLEISPLRSVGEGSDFFQYMINRNIVPNALGMPTDMEILYRNGKLEKGDSLILMTDGILDNLKIIAKDNIVADCSGIKDLRFIIGDSSDPKDIVKKITSAVFERLENRTVHLEEGEKFTSKSDDIALVVAKFGQMSKVRRLSKKKGKRL